MYVAYKRLRAFSHYLLFAVFMATSFYMALSADMSAAAEISSTPGANLISSLVPGHWLKVPNSKMEAVFPDCSSGCDYSAVDGPWAVMGAWSGATLDTKRNRLLVWGGGHKDYGGNEVYAFSLNTLTWSRLTGPSSSAGYYMRTSSGVAITAGATLGIMPDGNPASRHTYSGLAYIPPPIDKMFAAGGADYPTGVSDNFAWLFDQTTNTWKQASNRGVSLSGYGNIAAYDPVTQHVWYINGPAIKEYNPETDHWTVHPGGYNNPTIYRVGAIDPDSHELVELDKGNLHVWPLHVGEIRYTNPTSSGDQTIQKARYPGFVWDPDAKVFVGWDGGADVYTLDPRSWSWTMHPPAADNTVVPTKATETGIYGRWQYVPSMGVFVGVNETNQNVYIYKPDFGANAAAPPLRAPAATFSALPASISLSSISTQAPFAQTNNCPSALKQGESCTVSVTFGPQSTTSQQGDLFIKTSGGEQTVSLTGVGTSRSWSAPTLSLSASQVSITSGQVITLSWTSTNVTKCTASGGWSGTKAINGGVSLSPITDTIYTLTCTGAAGSVSRSVSIAMQSSSTVPTDATVTSFALTSAISGLVPFTVGLAFKDGDIPDTPVLSIPRAQVIVKRRWNDGSVKMAIASGEIQLTAHSRKTVTVSNGLAAPGTNLTAADIAAAQPTATVKLGSYGIVHLSDLLSQPFSTWVSGPEMVEAHYRATVGSDPGMVVWFYVRLYQSGTMWVRTVVDNGYLDAPDGQVAPKADYTYVPTVTIGSTTIYDNGGASLTQYHNTRWTQTGWIGISNPRLVPHFDTRYLMATKLVPNYMVNTPSDSKLNNLYQTYLPLQHGQISMHMGTGGYQPDIGLLPNWDALYLTSNGDARTYHSVLANAEADNSYGIVWNSVKTGLPPLPADYPYWTVNGAHAGGETQIFTGTLEWEANHFPSEGYLAYLLTGDYYFLGTMEDNVAAIYFTQLAGGSRGGGLTKIMFGETRGRAWGDRSIGQLVAIGPLDDPFVTQMRSVLSNEAAFWLKRVQEPGINQLGYIWSGSLPKGTAAYGIGTLSAWMENFWIASDGYVSDMQPFADMSTWDKVRDWMFKAVVGLTGPGGIDGFCYADASAPTLKVSDTSTPDVTQWYDSWRKVYTETLRTTDATCGKTLLGTKAAAPSDASTGYWGNLLPAISYAVDHNAPGALAAWSRLTHATNWNVVLNSGFGNTPVWGVVPRTTGYTATATPVPPAKATGLPKLAAARITSGQRGVSTFFPGLASSFSAVVSSLLVRKADAAELSLVISPTSIDFGSVAVGQTSAPKTVTITYNGSGSSPSTSGNPTNPASATPLLRLHFNLSTQHF